MSTLSLMDNAFVLFETNDTPLHVSGLVFLDVPKGLNKGFGRELYTKLLTYSEVKPPFNFKLDLSLTNLPRWEVEPQVDLSYHIQLAMLPKPGSHSQLMELVSRIHGQLLDRTRPLWEFWVIEGLEDGRVALCFKFHHALADGVRASGIFTNSCTVKPDDENYKPFWQYELETKAKDDQPMPHVGLADKLFDAMHMATKQVTRQALTIPGFLKLGSKIAMSALNLGHSALTVPFSAQKTRFNLSPTRSRNVSLATFPIDTFKGIGRMTGVSINDVVLAVCDVALQRYMRENNWKLKKPLVVLMPLNIRKGKEKPSSHGNKISFGLVEMGKTSDSPANKLLAINKSTSGIKTEASELSAAYSEYAMAVNAISTVEGLLKLNKYLPPASNLIISNVPGPTEARYFMGVKVDEVFPLSLLMPGQTLNITLYSYKGLLHFGLVCCKKSLPGFEKMSQYLSDALVELQKDVVAVAGQMVVRQLDWMEEQKNSVEEVDQEKLSETTENAEAYTEKPEIQGAKHKIKAESGLKNAENSEDPVAA